MIRQRGNSMVGLLAAVVVLMVLVVAFIKGPSLFGKSGSTTPARKDGKGTTVLGAAKYRAEDEVCRSNLNQQRLSIKVYQASSDEQFPPTLRETRIGAQFESCPLGKEPYRYNPSTGAVQCPHPGHEAY